MDKATAQLFDLQGWIIYRTEHQQDSINIYAGRPRKAARCPTCRNITSRTYGRARQWRRKLHTWCNEKPVYLWVRPRRFQCRVCKKVFTERFPGTRPWARRTARAEALLLQRLKASSFRHAAQESGTSPHSLRRLLLRCAGQQVNFEEALQDMEAFVLSIDEHSYRGRDMMVTVTCVWPKRQLLAILPNDRIKTLERFLRQLPDSVRSRIRAVCIDLKEAWRHAVKRVLPGAVLVADPFHVIQDANRRVDEARLVEQQVTGVRLPRWPLVKHEDGLTERQAAQLAAIRKHHKCEKR